MKTLLSIGTVIGIAVITSSLLGQPAHAACDASCSTPGGDGTGSYCKGTFVREESPLHNKPASSYTQLDFGRVGLLDGEYQCGRYADGSWWILAEQDGDGKHKVRVDVFRPEWDRVSHLNGQQHNEPDWRTWRGDNPAKAYHDATGDELPLGVAREDPLYGTGTTPQGRGYTYVCEDEGGCPISVIKEHSEEDFCLNHPNEPACSGKPGEMYSGRITRASRKANACEPDPGGKLVKRTKTHPETWVDKGRSCARFVTLYTIVDHVPDTDGDNRTDDEFRPVPIGNASFKRSLGSFNVSDLRTARWPHVADTTGMVSAKTFVELEQELRYPDFHWACSRWNFSSYCVPQHNMWSSSANSGTKDIAYAATRAQTESEWAIDLMFDEAKVDQESPRSPGRQALINLVQRGIDTYGAAKSGAIFYMTRFDGRMTNDGWGGHHLGDKTFPAIAAWLLDDPEMKRTMREDRLFDVDHLVTRVGGDYFIGGSPEDFGEPYQTCGGDWTMNVIPSGKPYDTACCGRRAYPMVHFARTLEAGVVAWMLGDEFDAQVWNVPGHRALTRAIIDPKISRGVDSEGVRHRQGPFCKSFRSDNRGTNQWTGRESAMIVQKFWPEHFDDGISGDPAPVDPAPGGDAPEEPEPGTGTLAPPVLLSD